MSVHLFNKDIPIYNAVLKKCDNRERFCSIKVRCNLIIIKVIVIIIIIEIIITIVIIIIIMLMMIMLMMIIIMEFNNSIFTSIIQIEFGFRHVGFCARRKTGEPGKNPPRKASINNKLNTHERQVWESNPSHKGGRQALIHCATRTPKIPPPPHYSHCSHCHHQASFGWVQKILTGPNQNCPLPPRYHLQSILYVLPRGHKPKLEAFRVRG